MNRLFSPRFYVVEANKFTDTPTNEQSTLPPKMPSATGQSWEKYKKEFADDEEPEKKITPLTDEYVHR